MFSEQSKHNRPCLNSGEVTIAAMYLRRVKFVGRSFAPGAPPLTHVFIRLATAAKNLGVDLRRPCREQTYGGMNQAMVVRFTAFNDWSPRNLYVGGHHAPRTTQHHTDNIVFCLA
jgi:hypothetical protein